MCIGRDGFSFGADSICASRSFLRIRPPTPCPSTWLRSTPCSSAIRRTTGETNAERSGSPSDGCGLAVGGGGSATGAFSVASASAACDAGDPPESISAITWPTGTVSPGSARIFASMPEAGEGISTSTLSVVTSAIGSSAATWSPTLLRHSRIVPSETLMPIWGISTETLVAEEFTESLLHVRELRQDGLLERRAERDRHVGRREAPDRRVEVLERLLGDQGRHLGADPAGARRLVCDQDLRGLPGASEDRLGVQRTEASQVDHLDVLAELLDCLHREVDAGA